MLWSWLRWCLYMYTCMYVCHVWQSHHGSRLFYANVLCMYVCMYVINWLDHYYFVLMFICIYVIDWLDHYYFVLMFICMYVYVCIHCMTGTWFFMLMFMYMYICMHLYMSLSDRVIGDHSCGRMIAYVGEWHEEVPGLTRNQLGGVALTNLWVQYPVVMSWYYVIILCLCYGQVILRGYISEMKSLWLAACWDKDGWQRDTRRKVAW